LTETDQRLTFPVALPAPRFGSTRHAAPTEPDSPYVLPVKGSRENESERLHRTGPMPRLRVSQSHFVLSLLDSARSKPHQFAFDPSRDASADSGFLVGLAASTIPRSLLLERSLQRDASDRFLPPNQLRTTAPVLSVLEFAFEENGVSRRASSLRPNHRGFEEGFSPCLRPFAIEPLASLSLSGFPSHRLKWGSAMSIEPRPLFPAFREECAVPNDRGCLPSVALELSSVCTIPRRPLRRRGSLFRRRLAWRSFNDASALRPLHP